MTPPIITPEQLQHAMDQGWSPARAAREFGTTRYMVEQAALATGIELPRGVPRPHMAEFDESTAYNRVSAGESIRAVARSVGLPYTTFVRRLMSWAEREGLWWPPVDPAKPVGQRCYEAYRHLRSWDAVAAEVMSKSTSAKPGRMAMTRAKRWALAGGGRATWPIPKPQSEAMCPD